jgi:hypothetical protein
MVIVYWLLFIVCVAVCVKRACRLRQTAPSIASDERVAWLERACHLAQTTVSLSMEHGTLCIDCWSELLQTFFSGGKKVALPHPISPFHSKKSTDDFNNPLSTKLLLVIRLVCHEKT